MKPGYIKTEAGVVPEDWTVTNLGNVIQLQRGFDLPHRKRTAGSVPIISSSGASDTHNEALVTAPGVVTGRYGTIGEVYYIEQDFWPLNTTLYIKDFKGNNPLFISYLLRTIDFASHSGKSGVPGVNRNDLHELDIALPASVAEQQAIADTLGSVDALLREQRALLAKKRDLKQATQAALLTRARRLPGFSGEWQERTLGEVFIFFSTGNNSRSELVAHGETAYLHYGDIHTKYHDFLDCRSAKLPFLPQIKAKNLTALQEGDLIVSDASEDYEGVGKSVEIVGIGDKKIVAGLHTHLLRGNKSLVADGFKGFIPSMPKTKRFLQQMATGVTVYGLSKGNIKEAPVDLPPLDEQRAIAKLLTDMDAELAGLITQVAKTEALKQGLMQDLLTGTIRLTGTAPSPTV